MRNMHLFWDGGSKFAWRNRAPPKVVAKAVAVASREGSKTRPSLFFLACGQAGSGLESRSGLGLAQLSAQARTQQTI